MCIRDSAIPCIISLLVASLYNIVDQIFIANATYLGARGAIELLRPLPGKDDPKVFFVGNGLSADYLNCCLLYTSQQGGVFSMESLFICF